MTKRTISIGEDVYQSIEFAYNHEESALSIENWILTKIDRGLKLPEVSFNIDWASPQVGWPVQDRYAVTLETDNAEILEAHPQVIDQALRRYFQTYYTTDHFKRMPGSWLDKMLMKFEKLTLQPMNVWIDKRILADRLVIGHVIMMAVMVFIIDFLLMRCFGWPFDLAKAHSISSWSHMAANQATFVIVIAWMIIIASVKWKYLANEVCKLSMTLVKAIGMPLIVAAVLAFGLGKDSKMIQLPFATPVAFLIDAIILSAMILFSIMCVREARIFAEETRKNANDLAVYYSKLD